MKSLQQHKKQKTIDFHLLQRNKEQKDFPVWLEMQNRGNCSEVEGINVQHFISKLCSFFLLNLPI